MNYTLICCILGALLVAYIAGMIYSRIKNKENLKREQGYTMQLTSALSQSDFYLKYKNKVTLQAFIFWAAGILLSLSLILIVYLPVFQVKTELLGITTVSKSFSFFDNGIAVQSSYNESFKCFTDIEPLVLIFVIAILTALAVFIPVSSFFYNVKTFDSKLRTEKFIIKTKTNRLTYPDLETYPWGYLACIAILIACSVVCKNAEYNFTSEIPYYTVKDINNCICYYTNDGVLILKVFQNYFKEFNAISPLIALPIIIFIASVGLYAVGVFIKNKTKNEILNEEIAATAPNENISEQ